MDNTVRRPMLPLTVFKTLCGFYTAGCRNTKLRLTVQAYCAVVSFAYFVFCTAYLMHKTITVPQTPVSFSFTFMDTVTTITLTYYRVQYIKHYDVNNNVFENIQFVDSCLESFDIIRISSMNYRSLITVYFIVSTLLHTYISYLDLWVHKQMFQEREIPHYDIDTPCMSTAKVLFILFGNLLTHEFLYLLYTAYKAASSARCVVQSFEDRNFAWTNHRASRRSNTLMTNLRYLKTIQAACTAVNDAYSTMQNFYSYFVCFNIIVYIFMGTYNVLNQWTHSHILHYICPILTITEKVICPIVLCNAISTELRKTHAILKSYHYKQELSPLKENLERCVRQFAHTDIGFDCGFFKIDSNVIGTVVSFISLFVFAALT